MRFPSSFPGWVSDAAPAPISAPARRTQVGREATEPMHADIRMLGSILGDIVREQNGDVVFDLVERARVESFRVRVRRRYPPGAPAHDSHRRR
ncbi:hypothetical protein [Mycobacterium tilburgii]|uniref:hypothetical protein n=1 Tax=Mycobacterium tilburgii TaxID=44467 RepID=UPI003898FB03